MKQLVRSHSASLIEAQCEIHTAIAGLWSSDSIQEYFDSVNETALPLMQERKPMYALVDFSGFVPQDQETSELIRNHLLACVKYGLKRIAILGASPLMKMQYRRLSQGIDVGFLDEKTQALTWLRR